MQTPIDWPPFAKVISIIKLDEFILRFTNLLCFSILAWSIVYITLNIIHLNGLRRKVKRYKNFVMLYNNF